MARAAMWQKRVKSAWSSVVKEPPPFLFRISPTPISSPRAKSGTASTLLVRKPVFLSKSGKNLGSL